MPINTYLTAVQAEAARGVATEHTFRPALKVLLETLDQGIAATNEPRRIACGAPDFQVTRGNLPVGHIEAKDLHVDLDKELRSAQMARYLKALPNLILTNYLEFRWFVNGELREQARIGRRDKHGKVLREHEGEGDLRRLLASFLAQEPPVVGTPRDLALRLAELARLTRGLIAETFAREGERGELHEQYEAFRKALIPGLDANEFADMYAQTLAYGLFAARVSQPASTNFTRYSAAQLLPRTNPFLSKLFYEIAGPDLDDRIAWAVDDIAALLARANMDEILRDFGKRTRQEDPVVHFYETFLAAYDAKMRESRGVYYTPEPVVSFIVRSVDHLLRTRFGKALGLADQDTLILDPATGTATFLYFVVEQIYTTLRQHGLEAGWNSYVGEGPRSLLRRLFGFELLMAPYAVAHLKLGLQLREKGYDFARNERLGVYLTNALDEGVPAQLAMPFARYIAEESAAAAEVKSSKPIMVVLGNPPYSKSSMNKGSWIGQIMEEYKKTVRLEETQIQALSDDYAKFLRFAQWRIDMTGHGIVAMITNNGFLDGPLFRDMRNSLLQSFDEIFILNLHGYIRNGNSSTIQGGENVFDIQQSVCISIFCKAGIDNGCKVLYQEHNGSRVEKYNLLTSENLNEINWINIYPQAPNYIFTPISLNMQQEQNAQYHLYDVFGNGNRNNDNHNFYGAGFVTQQDEFAISFKPEKLISNVHQLLEPKMTETELRSIFDLCTTNQWSFTRAREELRHTDFVALIKPVQYRPFDYRYSLFDRNVCTILRNRIMQQFDKANIALLTTRRVTRIPFNNVFVSDIRPEYKIASHDRNSIVFPLYFYPSAEKKQSQASLFDDASDEGAGPGGRRANLSAEFIKALTAKLGIAWVPDGRGDRRSTIGPEDVFHYAYAVFHSPTYRTRYAELLKIDFPRLPLTSDLALFADLAALGAELVDLHLLRIPGAVPPDAVGGNGGHPALVNLRTRFVGGGANTVEKVSYDAAEQRVHISKTHYFAGVDPATWEFRVGGYQVLDKWLKDRKGRALSFDDLLHYQRVVVALMETQRVMAAIDARIGGWEAFARE